jgi:type IV pilus assembly protein PilA
MTKRNGGFTLIEVMVALGVVLILMLMATPSYLDKSIRSQINEALPLADIAKTPIATAWAATKSFPADNASAGLPTADKIVNNFISSIAVENGAIHITFGNNAMHLLKGKILTLRPAVVEDTPAVPVTWVCGLAATPGNMAVKGNNKTDIPAGYLPFKCR